MPDRNRDRPLSPSDAHADKPVVTDVLMVGLLLGSSAALALVLSHSVLLLTFKLMVGQRPSLTTLGRPLVFALTLFCFWYVAPGVADSPLVARVMSLLGPP